MNDWILRCLTSSFLQSLWDDGDRGDLGPPRNHHGDLDDSSVRQDHFDVLRDRIIEFWRTILESHDGVDLVSIVYDDGSVLVFPHVIHIPWGMNQSPIDDARDPVITPSHEEYGRYDRSQDRTDCDDNQQFDQRETFISHSLFSP